MNIICDWCGREIHGFPYKAGNIKFPSWDFCQECSQTMAFYRKDSDERVELCGIRKYMKEIYIATKNMVVGPPEPPDAEIHIEKDEILIGIEFDEYGITVMKPNGILARISRNTEGYPPSGESYARYFAPFDGIKEL